MPGIFQLSIGNLIPEVREAVALGIKAVLLFGLPAHKDSAATGAYDPEGIVQLAVRAIKDEFPDLIVITDVCLCEYTDHGHCGVVQEGEVLNDVTLELLAKMAITHAESGADIVAPSDMMDGRVAAIRNALDDEGLTDTILMSYSSKFASAFYGPFREAADSAPAFGDRKTYQMDPANLEEAVRESLLDIEEGADMIMVKPALPFLDVIHAVKQRAVLEAVTGIKRAGADLIITYHAKDIATWLG
jgi:porphobilinogen synthase